MRDSARADSSSRFGSDRLKVPDQGRGTKHSDRRRIRFSGRPGESGRSHQRAQRRWLRPRQWGRRPRQETPRLGPVPEGPVAVAPRRPAGRGPVGLGSADPGSTDRQTISRLHRRRSRRSDRRLGSGGAAGLGRRGQRDRPDRAGLGISPRGSPLSARPGPCAGHHPDRRAGQPGPAANPTGRTGRPPLSGRVRAGRPIAKTIQSAKLKS